MSARFCVLSGCLENYQPLAATTIAKNKADYCRLYGYDLKLCREVSAPYRNGASHAQGFSWSRLAMMLSLVQSAAYDWVYCVGCDTMITNYAIGLGDLVAYAGNPGKTLPRVVIKMPPGVPAPVTTRWPRAKYRPDGQTHVIFPADRGSYVQADSFLVRCSAIGAAYLQDILDQYPVYKTHAWVEQQAMMDLRQKHAAITRIVPQCAMNSYDYWLFADRGSFYTEGIDCYGQRGQWQTGDFLIHWPSTPFEMRLRLARKYDAEVLR